MSIEMNSFKPKGFAKTNTTSDEKVRQVSNCLAYGCPMPASISAHTDGDGKWYCRHHFGKKVERFDAITHAIKKNLWMVDVAEKMMNAPIHYKGSKEANAFDIAFNDTKAKIMDAGREDLMPKKIENRHGVIVDETQKRYLAWANRILGTFDHEVYEAIKQ